MNKTHDVAQLISSNATTHAIMESKGKNDEIAVSVFNKIYLVKKCMH